MQLFALAGGVYVPQFGMYAITKQGPWAAAKHHSENKTSSSAAFSSLRILNG